MTTHCDETGTERVPVDAGLGVDPGPGENTTTLLVDDADEGAIYSLRRDVDCHGAIVRGLAQYLWTMRAELGRAVAFERVTETQADTFDETVPLPVAAVFGDGDEGSYDGSPRSPTQVVHRGERVQFTEPGGGVAALFQTATYSNRKIVAEVRASSELERAAIIAAIEDMVSPNLDRGGFALRLGHYFGAVARYTCLAQAREQEATEAGAGFWIARFKFAAIAPVLRVHRRPLADVRVVTTTGVAR